MVFKNDYINKEIHTSKFIKLICIPVLNRLTIYRCSTDETTGTTNSSFAHTPYSVDGVMTATTDSSRYISIYNPWSA